MKIVIFSIMTFFMFSPLGASAKTLNNDELSVSYANLISNTKVDIIPTSLFDMQSKSSTDIEFSVGISNTLKELEEKPQKSNNFMDRVVVWMSYRF